MATIRPENIKPGTRYNSRVLEDWQPSPWALSIAFAPRRRRLRRIIRR